MQGDVKRARPPSDQRFTAYLGRVPPQVSESVIRYVFGSCGNILEIRWQQDRTTGAFKGNGWIEFDSEASLTKALAQDGVVIEGQSITVARAVSKQPQYEANSTIHIKNLPSDITETEIRALFEHVGVPKAVRLGQESVRGFAGRAWVEFEDSRTATLALSQNMADVRGNAIEISFAKPKTASGSRALAPPPNMHVPAYPNPAILGTYNNFAPVANFGVPPAPYIDYTYAYGNASTAAAFPGANFQPGYGGYPRK